MAALQDCHTMECVDDFPTLPATEFVGCCPLQNCPKLAQFRTVIRSGAGKAGLTAGAAQGSALPKTYF
jgi:hypothetical protein